MFFIATREPPENSAVAPAPTVLPRSARDSPPPVSSSPKGPWFARAGGHSAPWRVLVFSSIRRHSQGCTYETRLSMCAVPGVSPGIFQFFHFSFSIRQTGSKRTRRSQTGETGSRVRKASKGAKAHGEELTFSSAEPAKKVGASGKRG